MEIKEFDFSKNKPIQDKTKVINNIILSFDIKHKKKEGLSALDSVLLQGKTDMKKTEKYSTLKSI